MSRFQGPQRLGAGRQLAATRRREAEQRQAAERDRDARRAAADAAPPRLLTDTERAALVDAAATLAATELLATLNWAVRVRPAV